MIEWHQADWLLTPQQTPYKQASVGVDRSVGKVAVVQTADEPAEFDFDGTTFLTPGLINAHTHLELYAPQPIAIEPGESIADWLLKVISWSRALMDAERLQACHHSIAEMIRTGTTCVNDITSTGLSLEALSQIGMRGIVSPEFFYPFHTDKPDVRGIVSRFEELRDRFSGHPLLSVGISPHSPYNVTPQAWAAVLSQVQPSLIHSHLAETQAEQKWFANGESVLDQVHHSVLGQRFGPTVQQMTAVEALSAVWSDKHIVAHGVYLEEADMTRLGEAGVSIAHCPRSNDWLSGDTISDLTRVQSHHIAVGLGTDSRLSCPDLDLRAEGRFAQKCHRLSAQAVFELMTEGSATAIKQPDTLGCLAPGYYADMVLWRHPDKDISDPYEVWLSPETEAVAVWINGRMVLERMI